MQVRKPAPLPLPEAPVKPAAALRWRDEWTQLRTLLKRAFLSKLRNRANLLTTIVEAPALAALIAAVLRYAESGSYDFASAYHVPTYLFLMLVVAMFLGLTNSADDVIRDRVVLNRERNLNVRLPYYLLSKVLALGLFAAIQCALFVLIGNAVLEVRGMFPAYFLFSFLTSLAGVAGGLLISSLVSDGKTAANIVPLVLIPQIILGGALIKYDEMNRDLDVFHRFSRWFTHHPDAERQAEFSRLQVPAICELVPMRWTYEALVVAQAKHNPVTLRQDRLQAKLERRIDQAPLAPDAKQRLDDLKDTLSILSGLECATVPEINRRLRRVDAILGGRPLADTKLRSTTTGLTAESIYVNQKIADMVDEAETESTDYRRQKIPGQEPPYLNVFFAAEKRYFGLRCGTLAVNTAVISLFTALCLGALHLSLRSQLRIRG